MPNLNNIIYTVTKLCTWNYLAQISYENFNFSLSELSIYSLYDVLYILYVPPRFRKCLSTIYNINLHFYYFRLIFKLIPLWPLRLALTLSWSLPPFVIFALFLY